MGKATVYSHLGNGLYSILYEPDNANAATRKTELETLKTALDAQLYGTNGLIEGRAVAETVYNNATAYFDAALNAWAACAMLLPPCTDQASLMKNVMQRGTARAEAGAALTTIKSAVAENRAQYYATTQEIAYLSNSAPAARLEQAWSIDFDSDNIIPTNTVAGTIETYGAKGGYAGGFMPAAHINLQTIVDPGYDGPRDHCVRAISSQPTAAMIFNWCQWLYVMSRNPQHAVGTVLSKFSPIQAYLDVELFGATPSSYQPGGYPFNGGYSTTLLNVPVDYLDCGAELFEAGDQVIVRFSGVNRASPTVIGFAENPQECKICLTSLITGMHGVAVDSILTTATGAVRQVNQPLNGDVINVSLSANNVGVLSGDNRDYCGTYDLGGKNKWIYMVGGDKWIVSITASLSMEPDNAYNFLSVSGTMIKFGTSEATAFTLFENVPGVWSDVFDNAWYSYYAGGGLPRAEVVEVGDVSRDGSKVILTVRRNNQPQAENNRGFLLLTLASTTSATVSVIADLEACKPNLPTLIKGTPPESLIYSASYHDFPVWYWFNAYDVVEPVLCTVSLDGIQDWTYLSMQLSVGGVVVTRLAQQGGSQYRPYTLDGDSGYGLTYGAYQMNPGSIQPSSIYEEPFRNAHEWFIETAHGVTPELRPIMCNVRVLSNKAVCLTMSMGIEDYERFGTWPNISQAWQAVEVHYGDIARPSGCPADPGTKIADVAKAEFTANAIGNTLNVTSVASGSIAVGDYISNSNLSTGATITALGTGTGNTGTYFMSDNVGNLTAINVLGYRPTGSVTNYTAPTGVVKAVVATDGYLRYTSYQPLTGQLIRNQAEPVCYI